MPFDWVNGPFVPIKLVSQWDLCSEIRGFESYIAGDMVGHLNNSQVWNLCLQSVFLLVVGWNTLSWGPQVTRCGVNFHRP